MVRGASARRGLRFIHLASAGLARVANFVGVFNNSDLVGMGSVMAVVVRRIETSVVDVTSWETSAEGVVIIMARLAT